MLNIKLRPYQEQCLEAINAHFAKGIKRQLVHLPTAAGKTVIFAHLIKKLRCRTLVLAHTCELLDQAKDKIQMIDPSLEVGLVNATNKEFHKPVVVASIQSARQPENLKQLQAQGFTLCIADECHHFGAESPRMILNTLGFGDGTDNLLVGFSATPTRNDGRGLGEIFDAIIFTKSIKEMISEGYLCQPKGIKVAIDLDLSQIPVDKGDFALSALAKAMDTDILNELVVNTYSEKAAGRKAICFGVSVNHAEHLSERFKAHGVTSEYISGETPTKERKELLSRFKEGKISVLCNCMVLTEGFDCPDIDCVIVARPTQSTSLYQQMVGRGLRRNPNKTDCLVLDFGDTHHTLCNTAILVGDAESIGQQEPRNSTMVSLAKTLPPSINQKLKHAILEFNPLGDDFFWQKDEVGYYLKGVGNKILRIIHSKEDLYDAVFCNANQSQHVAVDLSFEYAFAAAEDFARENRSHFVVSDLEADWRKLPISDKQKQLLKSYGYRAGIEELSRGQASTIISSGVLSRKAARR